MPVAWKRQDPLARRAETTPDRTALLAVDGEEAWTYRELHERVDGAAARLQTAGPDSSVTNSRVGLLLSPRPAFVVTLHAVWRLGWTAVGLNTTGTASELATSVDRADVDVLVCESETEPDTGAAGWNEVTPPLSVAELTDRDETDGSKPGVEPAVWEPTETALILFTSGTTGNPKAVQLTPENLESSAMASAVRLGVSPADRWLCCLPVYHMGGLAPAVRTVIYGTTLVIQTEFDTRVTQEAIEEYGVTGVSLVPTQLTRMLDDGWTPPDSLGTVLLGGAPTPDSLLDRATEAGVPVCPTYGLTETASQVATARPEDARTHAGTVGQPLVCTDVHLVADGEPVESGERGEIVVDGPTVTPGYLDAERTAAAVGEWGLHTGDVGYRDEDGRLYVEGRQDDLIQTGGELVAPADVREAICSHPAVDDAAVVGLTDEEWGERVATLVVPDVDSVGNSLDETDIRSHCRGRLADFKRPKSILLAEELPYTASGTIDRERVRETIRSRE
jgi:O-succinylbenzoic acid--CoA ligase